MENEKTIVVFDGTSAFIVSALEANITPDFEKLKVFDNMIEAQDFADDFNSKNNSNGCW